MAKYSLNKELPEEQANEFLQMYVQESDVPVNAESIKRNYVLYGIYKEIEYEIKQVDNKKNRRVEKVTEPIGFIALNANQDTVVIGAHYLLPDHAKNSFPEIYEFVVQSLKAGGTKTLSWLADTQTSNYISNHAKNKAIIHQHIGTPDDFLTGRKVTQPEEKGVDELLISSVNAPEEEEEIIEEEAQPQVTEKPLQNGSAEAYPGGS